MFAKKDETLRLGGALGPLQEMAVAGVITFTLKSIEKGSRLEVTYRLSGDSSHSLDKVAPFVDQVLSQQVARLKAFAETGKPE